ncbi:MAG TPA: hypothetical protein VMW83_04015 [Spirochaetia bacterium]|nr:hypothetical protein [Spirochaetia bacterium]
MSFQVYTPRGKRKSTEVEKRPSIRLSKTSIVLNKWAREALGPTEAVELAYDAESKVIRISISGHIPLKKTKIFAKGFFSRFGITFKGKIPAEVKDGLIFAQLS